MCHICLGDGEYSKQYYSPCLWVYINITLEFKHGCTSNKVTATMNTQKVEWIQISLQNFSVGWLAIGSGWQITEVTGISHAYIFDLWILYKKTLWKMGAAHVIECSQSNKEENFWEIFEVKILPQLYSFVYLVV